METAKKTAKQRRKVKRNRPRYKYEAQALKRDAEEFKRLLYIATAELENYKRANANGDGELKTEQNLLAEYQIEAIKLYESSCERLKQTSLLDVAALRDLLTRLLVALSEFAHKDLDKARKNYRPVNTNKPYAEPE